MVHFTRISPSKHYIENHSKAVPWEKVVEIILTSKAPRKRGCKYEIVKGGYYILFEIRQGALNVINAKR
jgi:hypothetical protein